MLTFFIILVIVTVAIVPLVQLAPSKRLRRIARLREYAAVHGLFVEFRETPGKEQLIRLAQFRPADVIYYGKRLRPPKGKPLDSNSWIAAPEGWRSLGKRVPVPASLLELPPEIFAASVDGSSCGVYWAESAEEETVEQIRTALEAWSEKLI
ncbi:MAG: hypothetical protein ACI9JM_000920 [Halioglobus sp.]|jgi:hypothetical protein